VNQHRSSDRHDGLNVAFGDSIVMMGADSSKESLLVELEKVFGKRLRCEVGSVVKKVLLGDHSGVSTHQFEGFFGLKGLRGAEGCLQFDVNVAGSRIDKDAAAFVHLAFFCLAFAGEQSASSGTNEVIDRDALSWKELILSKSVHTVSNNRSSGSRSGSLLLLGELASSTHRRVDESGARRVEPSRALRGRKRPGTHQKLDPPEREVSQTEVPARELLFCLC
jgi:hypothetical protein